MKPPVLLIILLCAFVANAQEKSSLLSEQHTHVKKDTAAITSLLKQSENWLPNDVAKSISAAVKALELALRSNSERHLARCYSQLAAANRNLRNSDLFIYDSLAVVHSRQSGDSVLWFNALQLYATDLLSDNKTDPTWSLLTNASAIADSLRQEPLLCRVAFVKGFYYYKKFKLNESLACFKKSLFLAQGMGDEKSAADSKKWMATATIFSGRRDSVTQLLFDVIDYYKRIRSYGDLGRAYSTLAFAYQAYGNITKAIEYYQSSAGCFNQAKQPLDAAYAYLSISPLYTARKSFDSAKTYIQDGEAILKKLQYRAGLALAKNYWGQFYSAQGDTEKAAASFRDAVELNKIVNNPLLRMANNSYAAVNLARAGKQKDADSLLSISMRQMQHTLPKELTATALERLKENHPVIDSTTHATLKEIFAGKKMPAISFDTAALNINPYTASNVASDSTIHALFNRQLTEQETKYKTKELNDSLHLQQQALVISRQQVATRNISLAAAAAVLALLSIIGWQQATRRKAAEAARKRAEADKLTIGNLLIALEHSTSNYLKKFSSFITFSKTKHGAAPALQEVEERMNAVLALQQMLGTNTPNSLINMNDYLQAICANLLQVFQSDRMVSFTLQAPVHLHHRTALPVGQLVNELATNSFKYAFQGRETGEIRIALQQDENNLYNLRVSDNGVGLPPRVERSTGMDLIEGFSNQLEGLFSFTHNGGAVFSLQFAASPQTTTHAEA